MIGDNIVIAAIVLLLIVWVGAAIYYGLHRSEPLEELHLNDSYVHDEEVERMLEKEGFEIIGGKYYIPLHIRVNDNEEQMTRVWVDCMVQRDKDWFPVRIVRERMELDWSSAGLRRLWSAYRLALPEAAGIVVINQADRSVKVICMDIGEPVDAV